MAFRHTTASFSMVTIISAAEIAHTLDGRREGRGWKCERLAAKVGNVDA